MKTQETNPASKSNLSHNAPTKETSGDTERLELDKFSRRQVAKCQVALLKLLARAVVARLSGDCSCP